MTVAAISTHMTAEEFYEWGHLPENRDRIFELVDGKVIEMSRPGERRDATCMNVGALLWNYTRQRKQGHVCSNDTGIILCLDSADRFGPDLILNRAESTYRELKVQYSEELPLLAVEVLSPNDGWGKTTRRINHFLSLGIPRVWLLDPEEETITIYQPGQLPKVLHNSDELTDPEMLPDFRCNVNEFFDLPGEEKERPI